MARLRIENRTVWLQVPISIMLDGADAATVRFNDKVELVVSEGDHSLQARLDHTVSVPLAFHANPRQTLGFACSASGVSEKMVFLRLL
jgi:hypothetical protein